MKKGNASANAGKASKANIGGPRPLLQGTTDARGAVGTRRTPRQRTSRLRPRVLRRQSHGRANAASRAGGSDLPHAPGAVAARGPEALSLVRGQYGGAKYTRRACATINVEHNMTDVIAGLRVLSHLDIPERDEELNAFYEKWKHDPLVTDKWLALQATVKRDNVVEDVKRLMEHPAFNRRNPNRIRSLIGAFATANFEGLHRADGEGYRPLTDFVIELDPVNPQIASRLVQAMIRWRRFGGDRKSCLRDQLDRVGSASTCSDNTYEICSRALER